MKETEKKFLTEMANGRNLFDNPPTKQELYYLDKWTDKGWWEYGVSLRGGWFTPEGKQVAQWYKTPKPSKLADIKALDNVLSKLI